MVLRNQKVFVLYDTRVHKKTEQNAFKYTYFNIKRFRILRKVMKEGKVQNLDFKVLRNLLTYSSVPNNRTCTLINFQDFSGKSKTKNLKKSILKSNFPIFFDRFSVLSLTATLRASRWAPGAPFTQVLLNVRFGYIRYWGGKWNCRYTSGIFR